MASDNTIGSEELSNQGLCRVSRGGSREGSGLTNPSSIYAASKAAGELLCEAYLKSNGLDIIIVRPFSIYGPRSPPYLVTTKIITQIISGNKVRIGNTSPRRDFVYVSDVISAFELLINKNLKGFSKFNVGFGKSFSILDICRKLIEISR